MYVEIKENKLLSWCEKPYLNYEFVDIDYETFDSEKYSVVDNVLIDISKTQQYKDKVSDIQKRVTLNNLIAQVKELDIRRIRAIAEPEIKDSQSGQTWIEYYNLQMQFLREQIASL